MKGNRRLALIALCFVASFALPSCRPLFVREVSGAVLALEGAAEGTHKGKTFHLAANDWIHPREVIATAPGSRIDLMLLPGILVELSGETEIEITRLRFARNGDETIRPMIAREASLRLIRGTLVAAIGQSQTRSRIFIQTAAGDLTAFDLRTFKIEVEGERARVMSVRGKANFRPAGADRPVAIDAGYFAEWSSHRAVLHAAADSDSAAQSEVPKLLKVEKRLFRLQSEFGFGLVPWLRR